MASGSRLRFCTPRSRSALPATEAKAAIHVCVLGHISFAGLGGNKSGRCQVSKTTGTHREVRQVLRRLRWSPQLMPRRWPQRIGGDALKGCSCRWLQKPVLAPGALLGIHIQHIFSLPSSSQTQSQVWPHAREAWKWRLAACCGNSWLPEHTASSLGRPSVF